YTRSHDLTGYFRYALTCEEGARLKFGSLNESQNEIAIGPGQAVPVLAIDVCLAEGTKAGQYSLDLIAGELVDYASGRSITPALASATLTVLEDVAPDQGCSPGGCFYNAPASSEVTGRYTLVGANGAPGSEVVVPFLIGANAEVQGYWFSVD